MAIQVASAAELRVMQQEKRKVFYPSSQVFLSGHNGYRRGNIHIFLGMEGAGKSTLMRSLIMDFLGLGNPEKDVLIYLSEETPEAFQCELLHGIATRPKMVDKIRIFSEQDDEMMTEYRGKHPLTPLLDETEKIDPEIIFVDNLTTADFYPDNFKVQGPTIKRIKKLAQTKDIPIVIFAHTNGVTAGIDRLIESNDIRGGKGVSMLAEFFYIMQRIETPTGFFPTIRVTKSRGQDLKEGSLFALNYNAANRIYNKSTPISFDAFNEQFKKRNRLTSK